MILVLTGTNPYSFERLITPMDTWAADTGSEVFIQLGNTKLEPTNCRYARFLTRDKLIDLIDKSEFIVSQGGFGSLRDCIKANKKIIAVPRYKEQGECLDDQEQVVRALEKQGLVIAVYDIADLNTALSKIKNWHNKAPEESKIADIINGYLDKLSVRKQ